MSRIQKGTLYTIMDPAMLGLLDSLHIAISQEDPSEPYTVLGGIGVQAKIVYAMSGGKGDVSQLAGVPEKLRPTSDIDMILGNPKLNTIFYDPKHGLNNGKIVPGKEGRISVFYQGLPKIDVGLGKGFNLSEDLSKDVVSYSELITLSRGNRQYHTKVPRAEHQILTKIDPLRQKDVQDLDTIIGLARANFLTMDMDFLLQQIQSHYPKESEYIMKKLSEFDRKLFNFC